MAGPRPLVIAIAGPNGAGKSTTAPSLLRDALRVSEFVNADAIAGGMSAFKPDSVAIPAGRVMLERMSHLAAHVAKTALRRYPEVAVAPELTEVFGGMAEVAARMARKMVDVVRNRDTGQAAELEHDDDVMDALHRRMFETLVSESWPHGVEAAVDAALLGRYYERYADHAVNAADQVIYLVTGQTPA